MLNHIDPELSYQMARERINRYLGSRHVDCCFAGI